MRELKEPWFCTKTFCAIAIAVGIAWFLFFYGAVGYVAWHFIQKWW